MFKSAYLLAALWPVVFFCSVAGAQEIGWKIVNRFPVLLKDRDFERLEAAWPNGAGPEQFVHQSAFTNRLRELLLHRRTAWLPAKGLYDRDALFRKRHLVSVRLGSAPEADCSWSIDDQEHARAACSDEVQMPIDIGASFSIRVKYRLADGEVRELTAADQSVRQKLIVALGDSFASGEGNPDLPAKWHDRKAMVGWFVDGTRAKNYLSAGAEWWDEACHRSLLSWQSLMAMHAAIVDPHAVVQFASFSCSGAEVYDGFFRAQHLPPGDSGAGQLRNVSAVKRDGGRGYVNNGFDFSDYSRPPTSPAIQYQRLLRNSQHNALVQLLCAPEQIAPATTWQRMAAIPGVTRHQTYFGAVERLTCRAPILKPDLVLLAFGGNDAAFGGVVKHSITPKDVRQDTAVLIRRLGWSAVKSILETVEPSIATKHGVARIPDIYGDLAAALKALGIDSGSVVALIYPDPTGDSRTIKNCDLRTRDGNAPLSMLTWKVLHDRLFGFNKFGVLYGVRATDFTALKGEYIEPLRAAQTSAACAAGWRRLDANVGIRSGGQDYSYCGISSECTSAGCAAGDRVRHWDKEAGSDEAGLPRLGHLTEFDPYDPQRSRGMRYAMDAILTSASLDSKGRLKPDWITSSAHPTASVHARIAQALVRGELQPAECSATP